MNDDKKELKENFAHNLKLARFLKQISANDLARQAGIQPLSRISLFEECRGKPSLDEYFSICKVLEQPMDSMMTKKAKIVIEYLGATNITNSVCAKCGGSGMVGNGPTSFNLKKCDCQS